MKAPASSFILRTATRNEEHVVDNSLTLDQFYDHEEAFIGLVGLSGFQACCSDDEDCPTDYIASDEEADHSDDGSLAEEIITDLEAQNLLETFFLAEVKGDEEELRYRFRYDKKAQKPSIDYLTCR
jgi:hypothetical protein